jgi:hypothetical protein
MLELSSKQLAILEHLAKNGFTIVSFPLYASAAGVRRGDCAVLLTPIPNGGMKLLGDPCWMIGNNLGVRARRNGRDLFVWKKLEIDATQERLLQLANFRRDVEALLEAGA